MSRKLASFGVALCILGLVACATSQPTRLHTFADPPMPERPVRPDSRLAIGIADIALPDYLDRPQIVTRTSATRMDVAEFDRWVESLDAITRRNLLQSLRNHLGTDKIVILPQSRPVRLDYQVAVDVTRFDAVLGGEMTLDARWLVLDGAGDQVLQDGRVLLSLPTGEATDLQGTVDAMSEGWSRLGTEVSSAISVLRGSARLGQATAN
ncbi:PqiC family protein [Geminicoccus flavidas]|uniref:PqiC family protein n=1 Tax=Geminicoccus flavidas TaxID=2506407 RepID=UPI0013573E33|nr:PqiC family protein [Geminicoccus flavidas]